MDANPMPPAITPTTPSDTPESVAAALHYPGKEYEPFGEEDLIAFLVSRDAEVEAQAAEIARLSAALAASEAKGQAMREALTKARPVVDAVADEASWCELRPNGPMTAFAWYIDGSFIDPDAAVAALSSIDAALSTVATTPQADTLTRELAETPPIRDRSISDRFAEAMRKDGAPLPLNDHPGGLIVDAQGQIVAMVQKDRVAAWIICAVNTLGGFRATQADSEGGGHG